MNEVTVSHKPGRSTKEQNFLGGMIGTAEIVGDIVSPVIDLDEIEAYSDSTAWEKYSGPEKA